VGPVKLRGFEFGSAVRPADGFSVGGDAVVTRELDGRIILAVIDILGHGPEAHTLAHRAQGLVETTSTATVPALIAMLDEELASSIGAAAGMVVLDPAIGEGFYAGVGNTVARVVGARAGDDRRLVSVDGIIGQRHRSIRVIPLRLAIGEQLVLHTDGISSRFSTFEYPQLASEDVTVCARELIRRFGRSHDDAACIVARRVS
jgi:hypothetical protein